MQQEGNAKQLISERIKGATNILVTVSTNPSVDELSAALSLTLMLNKLDKHGTAVFSGNIPPAIQFLEPNKTFENTVDSLRDFIIALDKEKADRLRYKVEDDVVRIFITPYRTTITQNDLDFSQGDFNVELIIALGVEKREDLDNAIIAHGRILHDATVVTINARDDHSTLGSIDWQDSNASSLCEMLVSISESLGSGLLDQQIANALLTGIVAATERFSNQHTSPRVMTMAAQLMAAGANQQLIATKLEEANEIPAQNTDGSTTLTEGGSTKVKKAAEAAKPQEKPKADGEMQVKHDKGGAAAKAANDLATTAEEEKLASQLDKTVTPPPMNANQINQQLAADTTAINASSAQAAQSSWKDREVQEPSMGGILNATTEEAMEENLAAQDEDRNHTILSHDAPLSSHGTPLSPPPSFPAFNSASMPPTKQANVPPLDFEPAPLPSPKPEPTPPTEPKPTSDDDIPTIAELEAEAHQKANAAPQTSSVDQARAAVSSALNAAPFNPANNPAQGNGTTAFPPIQHHAPPQPTPQFNLPLPDMSTLPPLPPTEPTSPTQPIASPPSLGTTPVTTPADGLPPLPQVNPAQQQPNAPPPQNTPVDPGQFHIPGQ